MLLIGEIKIIKQNLLEKSSLKEKVFFWYLSGKPMKYQSEYNLTDIQRICFSMFVLNAPIEKDLINRKRSSKVTGRMHYTQTLIDLAAMAKDNLEQERNNLLSYCKNHTTRDFYILNHIFPNISRDPPIPQGDIDQIALHLYKDDFPPEAWKSLLLRALQETSDLHDLYVVEQAYLRAMDDYPIIRSVNDIADVRNACEKFVEKVERRIKRTIKAISVLLVISISCWLAPFIYKNWDQADRVITIIGVLGVLIIFLIIILFGFIPDKVEFVNSRMERLIDWVFKKKEFDRSKLKKTLDKLKQIIQETLNPFTNNH